MDEASKRPLVFIREFCTDYFTFILLKGTKIQKLFKKDKKISKLLAD